MPGQVKPKPSSKRGERNHERRNGKAWKLRPCGKRHAPNKSRKKGATMSGKDIVCVSCMAISAA